MSKFIKVYSVVCVTFDYYRFEYYLGTYESEDKARQAILKDDKRSEFEVVVSEERHGDGREGDAPDHYWIVTKEISLG